MLRTGGDLGMLFISCDIKHLKHLAPLKAQETKPHQNENFDCLDLTARAKLCLTVPELYPLEELFYLLWSPTSHPKYDWVVISHSW